jgi:hypothetical protein
MSESFMLGFLPSVGGDRVFQFERRPGDPCRDIPETICGIKSGGASVSTEELDTETLII